MNTDTVINIKEPGMAQSMQTPRISERELIKRDAIAFQAKRKYSVASMFSGCGGMDLGFKGGFSVFGRNYERLPIDIIWSNEINEAACRTYRRNLDENIKRGNVWDLLEEIPQRVDALIGGFPCQDISINNGKAYS
jgi:site-specific DNA-cytosine methylase